MKICFYLYHMKQTQTPNTMNLSDRISNMTTPQIKEVLETMNRKPSTQWTKEEMTVENACIFELLFVRELKGWVEAYEARMN
jgi:hypothetical protein